MKTIPVFNASGKEIAKQSLPQQFSEPVRSDLVFRGVFTLQNNRRQPYGAMPYAGMRTSAKLSRRRRDYKGSYGMGISRVPRKILSKNGRRFNWVGAFAPGTVKGRRAHPPIAEKIWDKKLNIKERRKAIRSALAATIQLSFVQKRGHALPKLYPFAFETSIESLQKTSDVVALLSSVGLSQELARAEQKTIRPGHGKLRGRKYRKKKGPLIVVSSKCPLIEACRNLPGVDTVIVNNLNVELLAPGAQPGRLTLFTASALEQLDKKKLFM